MNTTQKVIRQIREFNDLSNFRRLKLLISRLTEKDIPVVINYLNAFTSYEDSETNTSLLFKYLLQNPASTEELVIEHFDIKKYNSFEKLVERLKDKIGYCLTSEIITQREGEYSKRYQSFYQILYKLARAEAYLGKINLPEEAYNEIGKIIQYAKTYEFYSLLLEALYLKRNFLMLRQGTKRFNEVTAEIMHYEKCRAAYYRARQWHNEYIQYSDFDGYRSGYKETFEKAIEELKQDYTETKSASVGYFYFIIKKGYYEEQRNFPLASEYALKLLNLVNDNKAIHQPRRMGTAYNQLADTYLCQRKLTQCLESVKAAQVYYKPNTYNYSLSEELEFWALFYSGQYEKAEAKIVSIINNIDYKQSPLIDNKRYYLYACTLFALGKLKECAKMLESVKEIHTDKRGWNVGIRILSLMTLLYKPEQEEIAIHKLASFKMHIRALRELKETRKRDLIIFKILDQLVKNKNDFSLVYGRMKEEFDLLESTDPDYGWQIKSHELIIFQLWIKSMVQRKPYSADISAGSNKSLAVI